MHLERFDTVSPLRILCTAFAPQHDTAGSRYPNPHLGGMAGCLNSVGAVKHALLEGYLQEIALHRLAQR